MALVSNDRTQAANEYEQITKNLKEIYKGYTDYSLFVTGHSLGRALAQILAFTLAGSELGKRIIPSDKPVTALKYASPKCKGIPYMDAFNKLEKERKLIIHKSQIREMLFLLVFLFYHALVDKENLALIFLFIPIRKQTSNTITWFRSASMYSISKEYLQDKSLRNTKNA